jgi:hypothetical protein
MEVGLELEEVKVAPRPLLGVVHRLTLGPTVGAAKARPRREADVEIDAPHPGIEGYIYRLPRRL